MDTSKKYFKMSENAIELQDGHLWINGDFYTDDIMKNHKEQFCVFEDSCDPPYDMYHPIWLPRQDQLQEMIKEKLPPRDSFILFEFVEFVRNLDSKHYEDSMEQLWLAFVMKEKYNKVWNGQDWEKIK